MLKLHDATRSGHHISAMRPHHHLAPLWRHHLLPGPVPRTHRLRPAVTLTAHSMRPVPDHDQPALSHDRATAQRARTSFQPRNRFDAGTVRCRRVHHGPLRSRISFHTASAPNASAVSRILHGRPGTRITFCQLKPSIAITNWPPTSWATISSSVRKSVTPMISLSFFD